MELNELEKLTVVKLREMAMEYEDITTATAMTKEQLVDVLCEKLGIERKAEVEVAQSVDRAGVKKQIKEFKAQARQAATNGDKAMAKRMRRKVHREKRQLRKSKPIVKKAS
ncbi:MAG: hypothetical protein KAW17_12575 [Candidatus Eisenbacteria sp.]|nr:hypothetical protein [Candidatus Eisenbacteria bacterium]